MDSFTIGTVAKRRWTNNIVRQLCTNSPRFLIYWRYVQGTQLKFKRASEVQGTSKAWKNSQSQCLSLLATNQIAHQRCSNDALTIGVSFADKMPNRGKAFRRNVPLEPVFSEPPETVLYFDEPSQDTVSLSSHESMPLLSQSVKRKLSVPAELKRENAVFRDMSSSDVSQSAGKRKDVSGWEPCCTGSVFFICSQFMFKNSVLISSNDRSSL